MLFFTFSHQHCGPRAPAGHKHSFPCVLHVGHLFPTKFSRFLLASQALAFSPHALSPPRNDAVITEFTVGRLDIQMNVSFHNPSPCICNPPTPPHPPPKQPGPGISSLGIDRCSHSSPPLMGCERKATLSSLPLPPRTGRGWKWSRALTHSVAQPEQCR